MWKGTSKNHISVHNTSLETILMLLQVKTLWENFPLIMCIEDVYEQHKYLLWQDTYHFIFHLHSADFTFHIKKKCCHFYSINRLCIDRYLLTNIYNRVTKRILCYVSFNCIVQQNYLIHFLNQFNTMPWGRWWQSRNLTNVLKAWCVNTYRTRDAQSYRNG